ncbi:MAG: hypothetical protein ACTHKX_07075 [Pseudolysinimonas sp.]
MSDPCAYCGGEQLVAVLLPGHVDVEAVLCLVCGRPQLVEVTQPGSAGS